MLGDAPPKVSATPVTKATVIAHFGTALGESCWEAFAKKKLDADAAVSLSQKLAKSWTGIRGALAKVMRPLAEIEAALKAAGAPMKSADIGVPVEFYRRAVGQAREIRDRYTFLDLAGDSGRLAPFAASA
jgi:glycerol-1-phosphate dehydrogenase [NAD(P)+]